MAKINGSEIQIKNEIDCINDNEPNTQLITPIYYKIYNYNNYVDVSNKPEGDYGYQY